MDGIIKNIKEKIVIRTFFEEIEFYVILYPIKIISNPDDLTS